jgi:cell division protein FtsB
MSEGQAALVEALVESDSNEEAMRNAEIQLERQRNRAQIRKLHERIQKLENEIKTMKNSIFWRFLD